MEKYIVSDGEVGLPLGIYSADDDRAAIALLRADNSIRQPSDKAIKVHRVDPEKIQNARLFALQSGNAELAEACRRAAENDDEWAYCEVLETMAQEEWEAAYRERMASGVY